MTEWATRKEENADFETTYDNNCAEKEPIESDKGVRCFDNSTMSAGLNYFFNSSLYPVEAQKSRRRYLFGQVRMLEDAF